MKVFLQCKLRLRSLDISQHLMCVCVYGWKSTVSSVQVSCWVLYWFFVTPRTAAHQASLSITNCWSLLKLMPIESVMPSNHLILSHPLLLPSIFPSTRFFSSESVLQMRWPNIEASASFFPMNIQGSFPLGLTDLISLQSKGLSSLLQHHSSKASVLQCSAFFMVQLSHAYMTTLTLRTFYSKI